MRYIPEKLYEVYYEGYAPIKVLADSASEAMDLTRSVCRDDGCHTKSYEALKVIDISYLLEV